MDLLKKSHKYIMIFKYILVLPPLQIVFLLNLVLAMRRLFILVSSRTTFASVTFQKSHYMDIYLFKRFFTRTNTTIVYFVRNIRHFLPVNLNITNQISVIHNCINIEKILIK